MHTEAEPVVKVKKPQKASSALKQSKKHQSKKNNENRKKPQGKAALRHEARYRLVQALYQVEIAKPKLGDLLTQFRTGLFEEEGQVKVDWPYFNESIAAILDNAVSIDSRYEPFIDRPLAQLGTIEKSILRLGVYELCHRLDIPYRVVINEALELAKQFAAAESHRYVNSILDQVASQVRQVEKKAT